MDLQPHSAALASFGLTPRECEVLVWAARGKRDSEIARILGIAPKTVGKHIEHILKKLAVETRTGAAIAAMDIIRLAS